MSADPAAELARIRANNAARQRKYAATHPEAKKIQRRKSRRASATLRETHREEYDIIYAGVKAAGDPAPWVTALKLLKEAHADEWRDLLATTA